MQLSLFALQRNRHFWRNAKHGLWHATKKVANHRQQGHLGFAQEVQRLLQPGMHVAELGCSGGHWCDRLEILARGCRYTGIDINPRVIEEARSRLPAATFVCADITRIKDLSAYDIVLACQVLFFLDEASVQSLFAALGPGGLIILSEPTLPDVDLGTRSVAMLNNKRGAKGATVMFAHPYPTMMHRLGIEVLTDHVTEHGKRLVAGLRPPTNISV
jgi:SAM-dependent methyltransferase